MSHIRLILEASCEQCDDMHSPAPHPGGKWTFLACLGSGGSRVVLDGIPDEWVERASRRMASFVEHTNVEITSKLVGHWMHDVLTAAVFGGNE